MESRLPSKPGNLVFIVDDDPAVLNSLKFSLEVEGFQVKVFHSGEELMAGPPFGEAACLVIDYQLSGMDGLALLAELRRRNVYFPAILTTSNPSAMVRRRAADAGLTIVEKPLLGNALAETIRMALQTARPHTGK